MKVAFNRESYLSYLAANFSWGPKGKSNSQEWVELMTCKVELYWMDFQHRSAYAAVQSAYGVNVGCPGEVTGNRNSSTILSRASTYHPILIVLWFINKDNTLHVTR